MNKDTDKTKEQLIAELAELRQKSQEREEDLLASKKDLQILVDSVNVIPWRFDVQGNRFTFVGGQVEKILGFPVESWTDLDSWAKNIHPEDRQAAVDYCFSCMQKGEDHGFEYRSLTPAGETIWIRDIVTVHCDERGTPAEMIGYMIDITERKQAEKNLKIQKERLGNILEGTNVGTWEWNVQTGETIFNEKWANIIGYSLYEISPVSIETWMKFAHPDDLKKSNELLEKHFKGDLDYYHFESRMKHKDGHWIWVLDRGKVISRDEDGKPLWVFGTHTDITERKRAEEALRESEERYRKAQEIGQVGNWEYNLQTTQFLGSDEAKRIYGLDMNSESFTPEEVDSCMPDLNRVSQALMDLIEKQKPYDVEFEVTTKDTGESRFVHSQAILQKDDNGNPLKVSGVIHDITERKQAEAEREKLNEQLQQAQKIESIGHLAGGVAHDFNNMLGIILGRTEMALRKMDADNPSVRDLNEIKTAAERSADLTRQLLAFARKEAIAPEILNLNETVADTLNMLQRLITESIQLSWKPGDDLWSIRMDSTQLDQILTNLCVNARDAIDGIGTITIATRNCSIAAEEQKVDFELPPGDYVRLSIADDGHGIDQDQLKQVFEPFFTTKELGRGTGLGLPSVYGAIKQNQGFIDVVSEPGKGTTFHIYLPRIAVKSETRQETPTTEIQHGSATILLVEDNQMLLDMIKAMLQESGYEVLEALTGAQAIALAKEHPDPIHLLLSDIVMPEMNGKDLRDILLGIRPEMDVIFMSGYTADIITQQGVVEADTHFLQKPISYEELTSKVHEVLDKG